jgi:hypothetical protein
VVSVSNPIGFPIKLRKQPKLTVGGLVFGNMRNKLIFADERMNLFEFL